MKPVKSMKPKGILKNLLKQLRISLQDKDVFKNNTNVTYISS